MNPTDDINIALRSLDSAQRDIDPTNARAQADLLSIMASDPAAVQQQDPSPLPSRNARPRRAGATPRRVALFGGIAAAVIAGMVVLPSLTGRDQAFATWSPTPTAVSVQQRPEAAADCRKNFNGESGTGYAENLDGAKVAIAESRGVWTTVVLAGSDGFSAMCISDDSSALFGKGMIGSIGISAGYADLEPRELFATDLGVGSMNGRDISLAAGHAGPGIVAVEYSSQTKGVVTATVSEGRFALWLPGDELRDAAGKGVEVVVTYGNGTTAINTLTLR